MTSKGLQRKRHRPVDSHAPAQASSRFGRRDLTSNQGLGLAHLIPDFKGARKGYEVRAKGLKTA